MKSQQFMAMSLSLLAMIGLTAPRWKMGIALATSRRLANGQIIQIQGEVQIERSHGSILSPSPGTYLYPGDQLLTTNGAQVLVYCADSTQWVVSAGEQQLNRCARETEEDKCNSSLVDCPDRGDKIAWSNAPIPYLISPRRTALLTQQPTLRWNRVPGATSYTVTVEGVTPKGEMVANWTTEVSETQVAYPGESPLNPGVEYLAIIQANPGASSLDEPSRPGGLHFTVLDPAQAEIVRDKAAEISQQDWEDSAKALAQVQLYAENHLIAAAIALLEELVASGVESAPIYRRLGELYLDELALVPQANTYYTKAVALVNPNDLEEQAAGLEGLAQTQLALDQNDAAIRSFNLALDVYQRLGDGERVKQLETTLEELINE
ncbi:hypothetical protein [Coleofasciculus sp. E2-BRE-01]|uniref:hypothetical protein n=1 Tax=Coleofasciculus sp. E2-BRE-01 TaxID=3069524 RepID=UPI0032FB4195